MKLKFTAPLFVLSLVFSGLIGSPAKAQSTRFECVADGNGGWSTVAIAPSGRRTTPLISWRSTYFRDFPPERRCRIVNQKLMQAAQENGGKFSGIVLRSEVVNDMGVFCYLLGGTNNSLRRGENVCNAHNHLMNYTPGTYINAHEALLAFTEKIKRPYDETVIPVQSQVMCAHEDDNKCEDLLASRMCIVDNVCSGLDYEFGDALDFVIKITDDEI